MQGRPIIYQPQFGFILRQQSLQIHLDEKTAKDFKWYIIFPNLVQRYCDSVRAVSIKRAAIQAVDGLLQRTCQVFCDVSSACGTGLLRLLRRIMLDMLDSCCILEYRNYIRMLEKFFLLSFRHNNPAGMLLHIHMICAAKIDLSGGA